MPSNKPSKDQSGTDYTAAGVLPYCLLGGDVLFLLGQERFYGGEFPDPQTHDCEHLSPSAHAATSSVKEHSSHKKTRGGLLWSDFGGRREAADCDAEGTASREFAEESLGLFHDAKLTKASIDCSTMKMGSKLRCPESRGKSVFMCRNGSYLMYAAQVDYVSDIYFQLATKEIEAGRGEGQDGCSEKLDFAWVPASQLLGAMRGGQRSTRGVVVRLGRCRFLRLFHKFVISLHKFNLAAVLQAIATATNSPTPTLPSPATCALPTAGGIPADPAISDRPPSESPARLSDPPIVWHPRRGTDMVMPTARTGKKRAWLGILSVCQSPRRGAFGEACAERRTEVIVAVQAAGTELSDVPTAVKRRPKRHYETDDERTQRAAAWALMMRTTGPEEPVGASLSVVADVPPLLAPMVI